MNKKILSLILAIVLITLSGYVLATECPFGITNDPEPGQCGRYVDENNDGYCDLSKEDIKTTKQPDSNNQKPEKENHYLLTSTIIIILGYLIGLIAVKKGKISVINHRKIWNWLLLITLIPTLISSVILALNIEYGIKIGQIADAGFGHITFGWMFLIISLLHFGWHFSYYFKKK